MVFKKKNQLIRATFSQTRRVMQRQVLVIQKAQRTADVPLLQYSDTTVDVPVAKDAEKTPQKQHEDCMTKYNEMKMDMKPSSAKLRTENKKQPVFNNQGRRDLRFTTRYKKGNRVMRCVILNAPAKTVVRRQSRSSMCQCLAVMKLAPHEHAQTGPEVQADAEDS